MNIIRDIRDKYQLCAGWQQPLIRALPDLIKLFILACLHLYFSPHHSKLIVNFQGRLLPSAPFRKCPLSPSKCFDSKSERKRISVFWKSISLLLTLGRRVELEFLNDQNTYLRRGVRSDAQLSCTETRFQKCC